MSLRAVPLGSILAPAAQSASMHSFSIHLVDTSSDQSAAAKGAIDWTRATLSEWPLIFAEDIISYDFARRITRLRPAAMARIPAPSAEGLPFVVAADVQRTCPGVFISGPSSLSFPSPASSWINGPGKGVLTSAH